MCRGLGPMPMRGGKVNDSPPSLSGSMPPRPESTLSMAQMNPNICARYLHGIIHLLPAHRELLDGIQKISGAFRTCMALSGNGCPISTAVWFRVTRETIVARIQDCFVAL